MSPNDQRAYDIVRKLFKNDNGDPFLLTDGQIQLFRAIYEKQNPRTQFECYTQYGKSDTVSMAVVLRAATFPEKWIILGGSKDKARIIMNKCIKHIFENQYLLSKFEVGKDESLERIKRERSKDRITFKIDDSGNLGEVVVLSADSRRKGDDAGDILVGHGGKNLIEDDAALIPDNIHAKAMRMLGGHADSFLLKITNSLERNHAFKSRYSDKYKTHIITWEQGVKEGRCTKEYIDEMRGVMDPIMFNAFYNCVYPPADMVDEQGWMSLLTEDEVEEAQKRSVQSIGKKRLGCDLAEGINYNVFVIRTDNHAMVHSKFHELDLMKTADKIGETLNKERIYSEYVFLDAVGIGSGIVSRCKQMGLEVNGVKAGEKASPKSKYELVDNPIEFRNLKAEMAWKAKMWIQQGGALEPNPDWLQLTKIRYREGAGKVIEIMPKEQMRARGIMGPSESPDAADALFLTFAPEQITFNMTATESIKPYYPELGF
jgi:hypothetical protein